MINVLAHPKTMAAEFLRALVSGEVNGDAVIETQNGWEPGSSNERCQVAIRRNDQTLFATFMLAETEPVDFKGIRLLTSSDVAPLFYISFHAWIIGCHNEDSTRAAFPQIARKFIGEFFLSA